MKEVVVHGRTFELYLTAETITEKVSALGARLKADFKGISLSTSLQEHVSVTFEPSNYSVDLSN